MIPPLIFAHGPGVKVAIAIGVLWVFFACGSPALVAWLTKRKRKVAALAVGIPTVGLTGFVALFYRMESTAVQCSTCFSRGLCRFCYRLSLS